MRFLEAVSMFIRIEFEAGPGIIINLRQEQTATIRKLSEALPFSSSSNVWGKEVYFDAPFHAGLEEDARAEMNVGDVAFWPDGDALAVFFGRTPASVDERPRAYSPCNIVGRIETDPATLQQVTQGQRLKVSLR